ncbi:putative HTH-type transcriptional regulator YusO [Desulfosporosinus acididurans]|uniref:Putative HTH-type transcriptional regulator YusO n=1 Tax=Desulfosporosinus acididurans TaxID=476652 RepID=A0A0J1FQC0_9FIRM|nr:MarR family winged helix-turn-helix transcriptional regulator [Desulfosporosinus acididurans]KLU65684.1 putative HTH-type transcriptional regulator YusO [Desulfosporosinus acididurans]
MSSDQEKLIYAFEFYRLIKQITRQMEIYREKVAKLVGLSGAQLYILWELLIDGSLSYSDLAYRSGLAKNTLSSLAKTLLKKKLISQTSNPDDGRVTYLALTEAGKQIMEQVIDFSLSISPEGLNYLEKILSIDHQENKDILSYLRPIIRNDWG